MQKLKAGDTGELSSLQNLTYAYDAVGNVDWIKDWKAGSPQMQDFTVDRLNRLVSAVASGGTNGNYGAETYGYSNAGNLTSKTGVGLYGYGAQASSCPEGALVKKHAVVTAGSNSYCYDQNGNQRRRTVGGSTYTLIYDAENRLVSVSGAATASFTYDADGNRIKSVVNGETTIFVGSLYEKKLVGSTTTHTKYYTFGGRRIAVRVAGILSWLLSDHLGSTAVTADGATGGRTGELWYKPWGESRGTPYGVTPTTYRFTGQREDASIGLYFYHARYYDPAVGRFISADTIVPQPGNPQSLNRYSYVGNQPLIYIDPTGHAQVCGSDVDGGCGGSDALHAIETYLMQGKYRWGYLEARLAYYQFFLAHPNASAPESYQPLTRNPAAAQELKGLMSLAYAHAQSEMGAPNTPGVMLGAATDKWFGRRVAIQCGCERGLRHGHLCGGFTRQVGWFWRRCVG